MIFSTNTAVFPIWFDMESFTGAAVDWTETQHLSSGWLKARTRTQFVTMTSRDERGRIEVTPQNDGMRVANGLEMDFAAIVVSDDKGQLFIARNLAAGAAATATPLQKEDENLLSRMVKEHPMELPPGLDAYNATSAMGSFSPRPYYSYGYTATPFFYSGSVAEQVLASATGAGTTKLAPPVRGYVGITDAVPQLESGVGETSPEDDLHVVVGKY